MPENKKSEIVIALYHAEDWCGPCKKFAPIWKEFIKKIEDNEDYKYIKIDCSDGNCTKQEESKDLEKNISGKLYDKITTYKINGYPTVLLFVDDNEPKNFNGNRDVKTLFEFLETNGEKHAEKVGGKGSEDNAFEEYQEEGDGNFDQCGGNCDGGKCEFKGGKKSKGEEYYKMKYFKYKAKYIELKSRYNI